MNATKKYIKAQIELWKARKESHEESGNSVSFAYSEGVENGLRLALMKIELEEQNIANQVWEKEALQKLTHESRN